MLSATAASGHGDVASGQCEGCPRKTLIHLVKSLSWLPRSVSAVVQARSLTAWRPRVYGMASIRIRSRTGPLPPLQPGVVPGCTGWHRSVSAVVQARSLPYSLASQGVRDGIDPYPQSYRPAPSLTAGSVQVVRGVISVSVIARNRVDTSDLCITVVFRFIHRYQ
jgi:hypothetical protein